MLSGGWLDDGIIQGKDCGDDLSEVEIDPHLGSCKYTLRGTHELVCNVNCTYIVYIDIPHHSVLVLSKEPIIYMFRGCSEYCAHITCSCSYIK